MKTTLAVLVVAVVIAVAWVMVRDFEEQPDMNPPSPAEMGKQPEGFNLLETSRERDAEELGARAGVSADVPQDSVEQDSEEGLDPATVGSLSVQVVAMETGEPVQGVHLHMEAFGEQPDLAVEWVEGNAEDDSPITDDEGRASFLFAPDAYIRIWATILPDGATVDRRLEPFVKGEARTLRLELPIQPDSYFVGRVVTADSGKPISDALIRFLSYEFFFLPDGTQSISSRTIQELRTGPDGWFETPLGTWREQYARVDVEGFGPMMFLLDHGHEDRQKALVVRLQRGAILRGLISSDSNCSDLVIRVVASGHELNAGSEYSFEGVADDRRETSVAPDGTWELTDLAPEVGLQVELWRGGTRVRRESEPLRLRPGETRTLEWQVGGGTTVRGRAVNADTHEPLAALPIWLIAGDQAWTFLNEYTEPLARTTTDEEGYFTFSDLAPGEWGIGPEPPKYQQEPPGDDAIAPSATAFSILEGAATVEVEVRLHRGLFIRGEVLGHDGGIARSAYVRGFCSDSWVRVSCEAEVGRFRLGPLVPGSYQLSASGGSHAAESESVTAMAGDVDIVLQLRAGGSLQGKLVDASSGKPLQGSIAVIQMPDEDADGLTILAGPDGRFVMTGLAPGVYDLFGRAGDLVGRLAGVVLDPLQSVQDLELPIGPGAVLVVTYHGVLERAAFRVNSGHAWIHVGGLEPGIESRVSLPAGQVSLYVDAWSANGDETHKAYTLDLVVGEETKVDLEDE